MRKPFLLHILTLSALLACPAVASPPNIVLIYADDLGWGELSCYGSERHETPHLDRMAAEGARFERFYVSTPSCGPSRAALLTGRYPYRTGVPSNPAPDANRDHGINESETTLAEILKRQGYATRAVGKWHLGHLPEFYPTRHGFDSYFGILYSNDMRPVMLCRDELAVEYPVVQNYLTQRYTDEAVAFIEEKKDGPFFLYFPHAMPHKPLAASEEYYTPESKEDLYSDVIRELDASVGRVLGKIKELGLDEKTLVLFSSDNGPWYGGRTGGLRGMKGSSWEGGIRVPGIVRWPGKIPAGQVIKEACATIDVVPTVCGLLDVDASSFKVDGHDIWPLLSATGPSPARAVYSWNGTRLMTVSEGKWKYHVTKASARFRKEKGEIWVDPRGPDGVTIIAPLEQSQPWEYPSPRDTPETAPAKADSLFDLHSDPGEQNDLADANPDVVKRLKNLADAALADAAKATMPRLAKPDTKPYLGPGRITEESAIPIEEALRRTRE